MSIKFVKGKTHYWLFLGAMHSVVLEFSSGIFWNRPIKGGRELTKVVGWKWAGLS